MPIGVEQDGLVANACLKIRRLVAQGDVIILEWGDDGVVPIGRQQSELASLLRNDGDGDEVINVDIAGAQEVVLWADDSVTVVVDYPEFPVLLNNLVCLKVYFPNHFQIAGHFFLVSHKCFQVGKRVGIVGHGSCEDDFQVQAFQCFAVQVEVSCDSLLLLLQREVFQMVLEANHVAFAAMHGLDVAVYLSLHFLANEVSDLQLFDWVGVFLVEVILCNHAKFPFFDKGSENFLISKIIACFFEKSL